MITQTTHITQPYVNFIVPNAGGKLKPISNGKIFIGMEGVDPKLGGNPIYYRDNEGTEVEISNPLYLNATGVIVDGPNSSKVINPYTKGPISILILNYNDDPVWSELEYVSVPSDTNHIHDFDTLEDAQKSMYLAVGDVLTIYERWAGIVGSGGVWDVVSGESANGANIVAHETLPIQLKLRTNKKINAVQAGIYPNDESKASENSAVYSVLEDLLSGGGVITFLPGDYYYSESLIIDDGLTILGEGGVTYREGHKGQVKFIFTEDTDGITLNGFSSYRNTIKDIHVANGLGAAESTKIGINFSSNGGGVGTRGLAGILENVTVSDFQSGIITSSTGDYAWNAEWKNIKIFRCQDSLVIDGSNGVSQIDGLHIDANGGYQASKNGITVITSNGFSIRNYGIESCTTGINWQCQNINHRVYLSEGYFENNSSADVIFNTGTKGQLYSDGCRMAWFGGYKAACIKAQPGCDIVSNWRNLHVRGSEDGADGLVRVTEFKTAGARVSIDGLLLDADAGIWQDFDEGVSPVEVRLVNFDKNLNSFELKRNSTNLNRMFASCVRGSVVKPTNDTFVIDLPGGNTLDLKYSGASVRAMVAGAFTEWLWDGNDFVATT